MNNKQMVDALCAEMDVIILERAHAARRIHKANERAKQSEIARNQSLHRQGR